MKAITQRHIHRRARPRWLIERQQVGVHNTVDQLDAANS
jgi:hypothetical protein